MISKFTADERKKYEKIQKCLAHPAAMKKTELKLSELAEIEIPEEGTGANIKNTNLEDFVKRGTFATREDYCAKVKDE